MHALPGACTGLRNGGHMSRIACYLRLVVWDLGFGKMMFLFDPEVDGGTGAVPCKGQSSAAVRRLAQLLRLGSIGEFRTLPVGINLALQCWLAGCPLGSQFSGPGQDLTQDFICEYFNMLISFLKINKNKNC
ncbi:hypothetical protein KC19_1G221900 [Ceratodon purpureus]|uniref:Uncharacterized protein n=1 Tax=Ceratodon purpureus TaxID=3225 RepID=A0A8T0JAA9_CERPU|nr:hypothetical protein KC19_1G221900 [Ceratodon purpureus]